MPLLWFTSGFVLGLFLSLGVSPPAGALLLLAASVVCSYLFLRSVGLRVGTFLLVVAGLLLGLARGGPSLLDPPGSLHLHHGEAVEARGQVTTLPELVSGRIKLGLEVAELRQAGESWAPATGVLLARVAPKVEPLPGRDYPYLAYGDRLVLRGVVESPEPFSGFDYPRYLASQGIGSVMSNALVVEVEAAPCCGWGQQRLHRFRTVLAGSLAPVSCRSLPQA